MFTHFIKREVIIDAYRHIGTQVGSEAAVVAHAEVPAATDLHRTEQGNFSAGIVLRRAGIDRRLD